MTEGKKISELETLKLLLDSKRARIIQIAAQNPITVSQIAEELGEKPSRLYYHVHKLEEAGFLELVETRQQGNLLEKYYKTTENNDFTFRVDETLLRDHSSTLLKSLMQVIIPGIRMLEKKAKFMEMQSDESTKFPYKTKVIASYEDMSAEEWKNKFEDLRKVINNDDRNLLKSEAQRSENIESKKENYAFVLLSYSVKDAEELGLLDNDES